MKDDSEKNLKVSDAVQKLALSKSFILDAIRTKTINYTKMADYLLPEIQELVDEKPSLPAVNMALRRFAQKYINEELDQKPDSTFYTHEEKVMLMEKIDIKINNGFSVCFCDSLKLAQIIDKISLNSDENGLISIIPRNHGYNLFLKDTLLPQICELKVSENFCSDLFKIEISLTDKNTKTLINELIPLVIKNKIKNQMIFCDDLLIIYCEQNLLIDILEFVHPARY